MQATNNNRRDSLLELFDPLAGPHTPPRSTGSASPDSSLGSSSDKENDSPMPACGPVTEFFMRVYKDPKHAPPLPQTPIGRLVDLSMSVDGEGEEEDLENGGDKENGEQMEGVEVGEVLEGCTRADDRTAEYLEEMRMPLAELQLEKLSPPSSEAQASMDVDPPASDSDSLSPRSPPIEPPSPPSVTAAPFGTPFADVINSINHRDSPNISINICAPDEGEDDMVFEPEYVSPFAPRNTPRDSHLSPDVSLTFSPDVSTSTLRRGVTTGSEDPRRISCDLQTSFSLVMQSTEMSFDLLNDKVSFFGQGQQAEHEHDQSWPGEHDTADFSTSKDANSTTGTGVEMMQAGDTSMEDDTFDFTKEKSKMDALDEKYGSIHQEQLRAVEKAAEAAVANSPRQRSKSEFPMPRFSLSPRPSPLREELLAAKHEAALEEFMHVQIPNIFSQPPKDLEPEAAQESKAPPPQTTQPRRSSIAAHTPLFRRKSIPALLFNTTTKSPTKSEHVRAASSSSTSTTSSADTTRPSLSRRGSVSSGKHERSTSASTSKAPTAVASLARRGSMSAMKVASLGRSTTFGTVKKLAKPDLEGTSTTSTSSSTGLNLNLSRRGSVSGLKLKAPPSDDNTRSTPSTSLARRGSVAGVKGLPAGRPSTTTAGPAKAGQLVRGVQRLGVSGKPTAPSAASVAPSRLLLGSTSQRTTSAAGAATRPSTASLSTSTARSSTTSVSGRMAAMGRSISSGLQRSTTTAPSTSSASVPKAGALRAPQGARPSASQAARPSTSQAARPSISQASNSNSTSTGPAASARRIPSKLPGLTRAGSVSVGVKPRKA